MSRWDDVKVIIAALLLTLVAVLVVLVKYFIEYEEVSDESTQSIFVNVIWIEHLFHNYQDDPNVSTFSPVVQQKRSKMKITGNGYIPCQG